MDTAEILATVSQRLSEGKTSEAERLCRSILAAVALEQTDRPLTSPRQLADTHRLLAVALRPHGSIQEILHHAERALELYRELDDPVSLGKCLVVIAQAHQAADDHLQALEVLQTAHDLFHAAGDQQQLCAAITNMGNAYLAKGDPVRARDAFLEAAAIGRKHGFDKEVGYAVGNLAIVYRHLGQPFEAIESAEEAIIHSVNARDEDSRARHLGNQGSAYQEIGELERAMALYEEALSIHRDLGNQRLVCTWLHNLGAVHLSLGDPDAALYHLEQALELSQRLGSTVSVVRTMGRIADINQRRGDVHTAITILHEALSIAESAGLGSDAASFHSSLAFLYTTAAELHQAQEHLNIAIPWLENMGARSQIASVYVFQGNLLAHPSNPSRDLESAVSWVCKGIEIMQEINAISKVIEAREILSGIYGALEMWEESALQLSTIVELHKGQISEEGRVRAQKAFFQRQIEEVRREHEHARMESVAKDVELQALIDRLVEKNELLSRVQQSLFTLRPYLRPQGEELLDDLERFIDQRLKADGTVPLVDQLIADVYVHFTDRLRTRLPTVTDMEVKVATLLHRQLTSSNIADALCLSKRTVEVHRHNLRKKLGLAPAEDIYQVLRRI